MVLLSLEYDYLFDEEIFHPMSIVRALEVILIEMLMRSQTYDTTSIPALVATLRSLFDRNHDMKTLISATVRNETTLAAFTSSCGQFRA